ncbi:MAG: alternative ribosome rescue aminoacyl-tRNA hydrolase ArfB [Wenyingzhuangia sp.]|uniref:alternative ribosome rescue aminoacyl-tRNA hydrolase ArfB n=1 Tax=Wenyingzhuangia sp. TaxID=1964193 RepID=UPI00321C0F6D
MNREEFTKELNFKAVRSSGAGGQHVNKVSTKIELTFNLQDSNALNLREKELLKEKLSSRLTKDHQLILCCDKTRSQHKNKEIAIKRCFDLIKQSLILPKKRRPTKPSRSAISKRIESKQKNAHKKYLRRKPPLE